MRLKTIIEGKLYSTIPSESGDDSSFDKLMEFLNDQEKLQDFFTERINDLKAFCDYHRKYFPKGSGSIGIIAATFRTLEDVDTIIDYLSAVDEGELTLEELFKPLDAFGNEYLLTSKAKGKKRPSWIRILAVRVEKECFVVSGGGIKLRDTLQNSDLKEELNKVRVLKSQLNAANVFCVGGIESIVKES